MAGPTVTGPGRGPTPRPSGPAASGRPPDPCNNAIAPGPGRGQGMGPFMFATGIENSYPVIAGGVRVDEMDKCGHYRRWREDLALVRALNIPYLRWGPAIYRTWPGPGRYDWDWTDRVLGEMHRLGVEPILDLCHFGLPDWLGDFQNWEFPAHFAD